MTSQAFDIDERAIAIDHRAGYRAFIVMSWLAVGALAVRGFRPEWLGWMGLPLDLLVILMGGALTHAAIRFRHRAAIGRLTVGAGTALLVAAIAAAALVALVR